MQPINAVTSMFWSASMDPLLRRSIFMFEAKGLEAKGVRSPISQKLPIIFTIRLFEMTHTGAEVAIEGLHTDMKVVVHQAVSVAQPIVSIANFAQ